MQNAVQWYLAWHYTLIILAPSFINLSGLKLAIGTNSTNSIIHIQGLDVL